MGRISIFKKLDHIAAVIQEFDSKNVEKSPRLYPTKEEHDKIVSYFKEHETDYVKMVEGKVSGTKSFKVSNIRVSHYSPGIIPNKKAVIVEGNGYVDATIKGFGEGSVGGNNIKLNIDVPYPLKK